MLVELAVDIHSMLVEGRSKEQLGYRTKWVHSLRDQVVVVHKDLK